MTLSSLGIYLVLCVIMEASNPVISAAKGSLKEPRRSSIAKQPVDRAKKGRGVAPSSCFSDSINVFLRKQAEGLGNIHGSQGSVCLGSSPISMEQAQASSSVFCFEN